MKKQFFPMLFALSVAALVQGASAAAGNAQAGAAKAAVCGACHGTDGNSAAPTFPKLAGQGTAYLLKQMHDIKAWDTATGDAKATTGRKVVQMTGMLRSLNEQDMADIAAYFAHQTMQLSGSKDTKVLLNSGKKVDALALGKRLYHAGNPETGVPACMGCHSPTGQGNAPAAFPRLGGQHPQYIAAQLKAFRAGERTNDGDNMTMRLAVKHLSNAEITAVADYIAGLH